MRKMLLVFSLAALMSSGGCGPAKPMSESEFRGFCYQSSGNPESSCDTLSLCNEYLPVIEIRETSLAQCLEQCGAVFKPQAVRFVLKGCSTAAANAKAWCERYCRTNYSQ